MTNYTRGTPELEKVYWSIHEAGHAVAAYLSGYSIDYVSVLPTEDEPDGATWYHNKGTRLGDEASDEEVNEDFRRVLRVDVAGAVAEYIAHKHDPSVPPLSYWQEIEEDERLGEALTVEPTKIYPWYLKYFARHLKTYKREFGPDRLIPPTVEMLCEHWGAVVEVADALREQGRVDGEEVEAIVRAHAVDLASGFPVRFS